MQQVIKIHENDNIAVALQPLASGFVVTLGEGYITLKEDIPAGHKFAIYDMDQGNEVIKYGYPIGTTTKSVKAGEWIHTHNVRTGLGNNLEYSYQPVNTVKNTYSDTNKKEDSSNGTDFFYGYRREDGSVGIRNEIWIIPTVGCINDIARTLEREGRAYLNEKLEVIAAFPHPYGCSQLGDDLINTQKILAGLVHHPNAAGVLVLGLGCENNNIELFKQQIGEFNTDRVKFLNMQDCEDEIEEGLRLIRELADYSLRFHREKIPADELIVGLKCGGSDGFSGITANPLVGAFSDLFTRRGGTTILTEVPEMFGAETILMNRCADEELFQKTVALINDFKDYYKKNEQPVYENPSPGNKKGGITTLEDKSLGCTQKSGSSVVSGVLSYGERAKVKGLQLLNAPGNDLVSSTALAATGAHLILFTTGRGTPYGTAVPTLKISSNSALAARKCSWIDFDAGRLLDEGSLQEMSEELYRLVLNTASGERVKSEINGCRDIAIFKSGVTL